MDLQQCLAIYCTSQYVQTVCKYFHAAFSNNSPEKFLIKGTNLWFLPDEGNLPCFECDTEFEHL
eukprot:12750758-Ditylum_brightwellii.AAC.1